jgi:hypothetical protein
MLVCRAADGRRTSWIQRMYGHHADRTHQRSVLVVAEFTLAHELPPSQQNCKCKPSVPRFIPAPSIVRLKLSARTASSVYGMGSAQHCCFEAGLARCTWPRLAPFLGWTLKLDSSSRLFQ